MMAIVFQLHLCLYKMKWSVIGVDDHLLPQNVILPLLVSLHDGIHIFIIGGVLPNFISKCLSMIGHSIPVLVEDCTDNIVQGVYLDFKWMLQVCECKYQCIAELVLQLNECLTLGLKLGKLFFHPSLSNLTQTPSDMGESQ